ncbi:aminoglycoside phosphotransferase family protein [Streptomyces triticagri]|uniref:Aminoglycoside phosphotransferase family protein n=1 Tax=Streptomyces triticagri TaxID=2293568 RepID=A0A372M7K3_9ACTN|nr:phosphotransferase [Streptomyces triticagri]RFU86839.1 aminoglycoside phosphotransferase family protein [Streptomyces triticagri]
MELVGQGREADVYALDGARVLRRFRDGRPAAGEARLLRWLAAQGYPVPAVHAAEGADLVMERLDGPLLSEALRSRPWRARAYGEMLGRLHRELHVLSAPDWLQRITGDEGTARVLHLDLHPENVVLTSRGPYVIDWTNARAGRPEIDPAMTFVILRGLVLPPHERLMLRVLLRAMSRTCGSDRRAGMPAATARRLADPHLTPAEAGRVRRLRVPGT